MLQGLRLGTKLPLMLVSISVVALAIMGITSYHLAATTLTNYGTERLEQTLDSRIDQLQLWSERQLAALHSASASQATNNAMRDLAAVWRRLDEISRAQVRSALQGGGAATGADIASAEYMMQYRLYHSGFKALAEQSQLLDIFLVDPEGNVVYSMQGDANFGTNLFAKVPRDSELMRVAQDAMKATQGGPFISLFTQDFTDRRGPRVVYIGVPLHNEIGAPTGALIFEVPLAPMAQTMTEARSLGQTGQGYIVEFDPGAADRAA